MRSKRVKNATVKRISKEFSSQEKINIYRAKSTSIRMERNRNSEDVVVEDMKRL